MGFQKLQTSLLVFALETVFAVMSLIGKVVSHQGKLIDDGHQLLVTLIHW